MIYNITELESGGIISDYSRPRHDLDRPIICISGGFDPLHPGHLHYISEAKASQNKSRLIAIVNGDSFLLRKKGYFLMHQFLRAQMLEALHIIDSVVVFESHRDSVAGALSIIQPNVFFNSGDRSPENKNMEEHFVCEEYNITMQYGAAKKIESSSEICDSMFEQMLTHKFNISTKLLESMIDRCANNQQYIDDAMQCVEVHCTGKIIPPPLKDKCPHLAHLLNEYSARLYSVDG